MTNNVTTVRQLHRKKALGDDWNEILETLSRYLWHRGEFNWTTTSCTSFFSLSLVTSEFNKTVIPMSYFFDLFELLPLKLWQPIEKIVVRELQRLGLGNANLQRPLPTSSDERGQRITLALLETIGFCFVWWLTCTMPASGALKGKRITSFIIDEKLSLRDS